MTTMKTLPFLPILCLAFSFFNCDKSLIESKKLKKDDYAGVYEISNLHITGLFQDWSDPRGDKTYEDTTIIANSTLFIRKKLFSDTMLVDGLLNSHAHHFVTDVTAVFKKNKLEIVHDKNPHWDTNNDIISGTIWLEGDSLYLDYYWDKSNWYNAGLGALPIIGIVKAKGVEL